MKMTMRGTGTGVEGFGGFKAWGCGFGNQILGFTV